ncbi:hypothetical protein Forpi1262_v006472 [Fusarium oxysporum f. sp. raphani]|uniref:Uncharacterized protein n=1 Tax=Fusarium oxysporum f. sp. raphani TaxID=96318 RepID=A0A8J5Q5S0_FUSOX|nr:hypothetical protein Forpi1262_v006472 [Fusarium oxysporum f. sp. raphani]
MSMSLGPFGNQIFNTQEHSLTWIFDTTSTAPTRPPQSNHRPRSEIKALCYSILSDEVFSSFSSVIVIVTTAAARGFIRTIMPKAPD